VTKTRRQASTRSSTIEAWDELYASSTAIIPPDAHVVALGRALRPGARVLEVGCGTGSNVVPLAELGHEVDALDTSPEGLRQCIERARARNVTRRVRTIQADMATYEYARDHYDLVIAIGALQHVVTSADAAPLAQLIARLKSATRVGGRHDFVIMTDIDAIVMARRKRLLTNAEMRTAWARGERTAMRITTELERAAALRVVMSQYSDPHWVVESLDVPREGGYRLFGRTQVVRAYFIEVIARRV
jgi:cyclopropane fatty-acyl-phospholipid synthase-like methyltransferase